MYYDAVTTGITETHLPSKVNPGQTAACSNGKCSTDCKCPCVGIIGKYGNCPSNCNSTVYCVDCPGGYIDSNGDCVKRFSPNRN